MPNTKSNTNQHGNCELKDEEIIKALECCSLKENERKCCECPLVYADMGCSIRLCKEALDLINRQKAEIERLQHILVSFMAEVENWEHKHGIDTSNIPKIAVLGTEKENIIKQTKSEAIKEFAERLKNRCDLYNGLTLYLEDIDNLVKEMTDKNDFKE